MNTKQQALIVVPLIICFIAATFGVLGYLTVITIGVPSRFGLPLLLRGIGVIVLILGFLLMGWVLRYRTPNEIIISTYASIRRAITGKQQDSRTSGMEPLVFQGPQRHVRHPMYFAVVVLLFGWWLMLYNTFLLFMAFFFFFWFNLVVIRFEEKELRSLHGDEYEAYARNVPRFFPSWRRRWP